MAGLRNSPTGEQGFYQSGASGIPGFEFALADGVGMGSACADVLPTGTKGEAMTFTRTSTALCPSLDGQTYTPISANHPVITSGNITSTWLGLYRDLAATNYALYSRQLSNGAWAGTNVTCVDGAGMDIGGTGGSECTSTDANGTVLQSISLTGAFNFSAYVKRKTGTGKIYYTYDGSHYVEITSGLSASIWKRVVALEHPSCAGGACITGTTAATWAGAANIGFRIETSGDAIYVDYVQEEAQVTPTLPIATTSVAVARTVGDASFASTGLSNTAGCARGTFIEGSVNTPSIVNDLIFATTAASGSSVLYHYNGSMIIDDNVTAVSMVRAKVYSVAQTWYSEWGRPATPTKMQIVRYDKVEAEGNFSGNIGWGASFRLGGGKSNDAYALRGVLKNVRISATPGSCFQ
jgi:hypothetical protein